MEIAHYVLGFIAYGLAFLVVSVVFFGWINNKNIKDEQH